MSVFNLSKLVNASEKWMSPAQRTNSLERPTKDLIACLADPNPSDFGKIIGRVRSLTAWQARVACVHLGRNDPTGWNSMLVHLTYNIDLTKLATLRSKMQGGAPSADPTVKPFHLLAMAMAMRQSESERWLGNAIIEARSSQLFGHNWGAQRDSPFRNYVCELYGRGAGGGNFPDSFGPYAGIFENWQNPVRLGDAIRAACDYHVEQINVKDPDEIGVFENNPHDIFPAEILALYHVRERLGLPTPAVDHPLLKTPFCEVPESIAYEPDPLVDQAIALAHQLLPEAVGKMR